MKQLNMSEFNAFYDTVTDDTDGGNFAVCGADTYLHIEKVTAGEKVGQVMLGVYKGEGMLYAEDARSSNLEFVTAYVGSEEEIIGQYTRLIADSARAYLSKF